MVEFYADFHAAAEELVVQLTATDRRFTRTLQDLADDAAAQARRYTPVSSHTVARPDGWPQPESGQLRDGTKTTNVRKGTEDLTVELYNDVPHAIFVHEGTGEYGPNGGNITPDNAEEGMLVWKTSFFGKAGWFRRASVQGQRPQKFLHEGYNQSIQHSRYFDQIVPLDED